MAFTVKYKELGMTKPFEIKGTVKNIKKTLELQKAITKSQEVMGSPESGIDETFEALEKMLDVQVSYLSNTLKLNAKQVALLEDLETSEVEALVADLVGKTFGATEDGEEEGKE